MRAGLSLFALNRGIVSALGLARMDVKRLAMAAETQTNWLPRVLGAMMLRPGWKYIFGTYTNAAARYLKFIFSTSDIALVEMTAAIMRVSINDTLLTRPSVTTTITNGTFSGSLAGWTDLDEAGAASAYLASGGGEFMQLVGNGTAHAIREQQVTVAGANIGVEHGIRVQVHTGPVYIRIGSASGGDQYVTETVLDNGWHSLSITPTGDFYVRFFSRRVAQVLVQSCTIESAGVVTLPTPYLAADLDKLRTEQSGDVIYIACDGYQQRKIERRGTRPNARSWSICRYAPQDGPFRGLNTTATTITPSGLNGNITLTASANFFNILHFGGLFSLTSSGQAVTATGSANGVTTSSIRVTGVDSDRVFSIIISGDASGSTVDLQRSYDNSTWATVGAPASWTADVTTTYDDNLDNQIVWYRLILTTRVAPDNVTMQLRIGSGSVRGICRITSYTSATQVGAEVLTDFGGTAAVTTWQEGQWSDFRGWPTSVRMHEGRLWWFGRNGIWGTISDSYESFDETALGNSAPINRTIGSGPVDNITWALSLKGLSLGADGAEHSVRASSLDEVITPTNFNVKSPSTQGSSAVEAAKIDKAGYFVDRSGTNVYELAFDQSDYDFQANNLMELNPGLGSPRIVRMDVQRRPDTRIHCVRSDGTVVVGVMNKAEDVLAWVVLTTDGLVEDVVVLPATLGNKDDQVYYVVKRTINSSTVRYLEKWAQESDCVGGTLNHQADSYITYSGASTATITGLSHLEGKQVVVWAAGADVGTVDSARPWTQTYTVSGGQITLAAATTSAVVGLGYTAQFKSAKLGLMPQGGSALNKDKVIRGVGFVMVNSHPKGVKFGPTLDDTGDLRMDDLPGIENGTSAGTAVRSSYDEAMIEFPGTWTTDSRVCLQAQAPRPATVLAVTIDMEQH